MTAINIAFSDLTHTGITVDTNYFPLGIGYVAGYAKKCFGDSINIDLFKYPNDLSVYLTKKEVQVACFSNYSWNLNLSYQVATKIKAHSPNVIIVFGGPNYADERSKQEEFLKSFPSIDFYIVGEGEVSFANLLGALMEVKFDLDLLTSSRSQLPGVHFLKKGNFFCNDISPRISDLSEIPSPILMGLFDKFIEADFIPMIQTNRGCPYSCTYCHDGGRYYTKISRFLRTVYEHELDYLAERSNVPCLTITDLNFGIYKEDYDIAKHIKKLSKERNWPTTIDITAAKNNKGYISKIVELLGNTFLMGASVQSTDALVLSKIKRKNLPLNELVELAKKSAQFGGNSFSEIILCLPGDSKEAYAKSLFDLLDAGINEVRSYQFILLDATEGASAQARADYGYQTKWRVLPRCYGAYTFYGETFHAAEFHEIVVSNSTMPHKDYLYCRKLGLFTEIFSNGRIFVELFDYLNDRGIKRSLIISRLLSFGLRDQQVIGGLLVDFENSENENFFDSKEDIEAFLLQPSAIERYVSGELGKNQMLYFRAKALIEHMGDCSKAIFGVARQALAEQDGLDPMVDLYLKNLEEYILACRGSLFSEASFSKRFDFDFVRLMEEHFSVDPMSRYKSNGVMVEFWRGQDQLDEINALLSQFGRNISGLGHLMQRANIYRLYRHPRYLASDRQT
ncbi:MAG: cobalamin-dependent protein [Sulfuricellaceae bacterium]